MLICSVNNTASRRKIWVSKEHDGNKEIYKTKATLYSKISQKGEKKTADNDIYSPLVRKPCHKKHDTN